MYVCIYIMEIVGGAGESRRKDYTLRVRVAHFQSTSMQAGWGLRRRVRRRSGTGEDSKDKRQRRRNKRRAGGREKGERRREKEARGEGEARSEKGGEERGDKGAERTESPANRHQNSEKRGHRRRRSRSGPIGPACTAGGGVVGGGGTWRAPDALRLRRMALVMALSDRVTRSVYTASPHPLRRPAAAAPTRSIHASASAGERLSLLWGGRARQRRESVPTAPARVRVEHADTCVRVRPEPQNARVTRTRIRLCGLVIAGRAATRDGARKATFHRRRGRMVSDAMADCVLLLSTTSSFALPFTLLIAHDCTATDTLL
jgi:hypothetical protein